MSLDSSLEHNWMGDRGYLQATEDGYQPQGFFQTTTTHVDIEYLPEQNGAQSFRMNGQNGTTLELKNPPFNQGPYSYNRTINSYRVLQDCPPPPYRAQFSNGEMSARSNVSPVFQFDPITPVDDMQVVISPTPSSASVSPTENKRKRRKTVTESKVMLIEEGHCRRPDHSHPTLDDSIKCLELRKKNREASQRSRLKKITTIEEQKFEIDRLRTIVLHKDAVIDRLMREHKLLVNKFAFMENELRELKHQQSYNISVMAPGSRTAIATVSEASNMVHTTQGSWNSNLQLLNTSKIEKLEAEKIIDEEVEKFRKMSMVENPPAHQNPLGLPIYPTPIERRMINYAFNVTSQQQDHCNNDTTSESETYHSSPDTNNNEDANDFAERPDILVLDEETDEFPPLQTLSTGPMTVTMTETLFNSPAYKIRIQSVQSTSPIRLVQLEK